MKDSESEFTAFAVGDEGLDRFGIPTATELSSRGTRIWCHAASLSQCEVAHSFVEAGTLCPSYRLPGGACILRVGGGAEEPTQKTRPRFVELGVYPDGSVASLQHTRPTYEFAVMARERWSGAGGAAPAPLISEVWRLIMSLRLHPEAEERASALAQSLFSLARRAGRGHEPRMQAARTILEASPMGGVRTKDLAKNLGVSESYLCRSFRRAFGTTLSHYSSILRGAYAAGMLWGTRMQIGEIVHVCGFSDQAHMSRMFVRQFGFAPAEFRRLAPCIGSGKAVAFAALHEP